MANPPIRGRPPRRARGGDLLSMVTEVRAGVLMAGVVLLAAVISAGAGVLPGRTVVPTDVIALFEPWRGVLPAPVNTVLGDPAEQLSATAAVAEALRGGHFPLWNPHVLAGHPIAGDPIVAAFNPVQALLLVLLPLHRAVAMQVLLQLVVAGGAMAFWVHTATGSRPAAAYAGATWVLAGYHQVWVAFPYFMAALMWLPLIPAAWERAARGRSIGWIAVGGLAGGMSLLGGHVQVSLFGLAVVSVYAALALAGLGVPRARGVICGLAIVGLAGLIAAPTLLPSAVQLADTVRPGWDPLTMRQTALPLRQAITAVVPWLFGRPDGDVYVGNQNTNELMVYIGVVPLLLALAAPWARRDRLGWVAGAMLLLVAAVALGLIGARVQAALPVTRYLIMRRWLSVWPLVAAFAGGAGVAAALQHRDAAKRLAEATMVAAVGLGAAAAAVSHLLVSTDLKDRAALLQGDVASALIVLTVGTLAVVFWARAASSPLRFAAVVLFAIADLAVFARGYSPAGHVATAYPLVPPLADVALAASAEGARIAPVHRDGIVLGPGVAPMVGLDTIDGYSSSLQRSYVRFVAAFSEPADDAALSGNLNMVGVRSIHPVLADLLNIAYVLTDAPIGPTSRLAVAGGAAAACPKWIQLGPGESASGTMSANADGLHRVDFLARAVAGDAKAPARGRLEVTRTLSDGTAEVVASQAVTVTSETTVTLYFQRVPDSAGQAFTAALHAESPVEACSTDSDASTLRTAAYAVDDEWPLAFSGNDLYAYRIADRPGAAWFVAAARIVASQEEALAAVTAPGFDPRTLVVVERRRSERDDPNSVSDDADSERDDPRRWGNAGLAPPPDTGGDSGSVPVVTRPYPGAIDVELGAVASGWLVVSEAYAPGWRAWVDGAEKPVERAYGGIQAVALPPDARIVLLRFDPVPVRRGLVLAGLGLAGVAALLAAGSLWNRRGRRGRGVVS